MSINKVNIKSITPPENIGSNAILQYNSANAQFQWVYDSSEYANTVTDYLVGVSPYMIKDSTSINNISIFANDGGNISYSDTLGQLIFSNYYSTLQGSVSGYASGGNPGLVNTIDKFPFATDANATDVGDLTQARYSVAGQSSTTHGYTSGGIKAPPFPLITNVIDKFSFSTDSNATDVGNLTQARYRGAGQSSGENGYTSGGVGGTPGNIIDKFPFAANGNATDVGDLTVARFYIAGQSSTTNGYTSGGITPVPTYSDVIDKFPFSSDSNAADVGNLITALSKPTGQSSAEMGYNYGGVIPPSSNSTVIQKFPFATDANSTDVGDLTVYTNEGAGQSSTSSGYSSGGLPSSPGIHKFPFSTDSNAADVGSLTQGRYGLAGQQI